MVKHVPCAISWWFTSLSSSKAVYPLVVHRVNYTNYPGIRVSSLIPQKEPRYERRKSPIPGRILCQPACLCVYCVSIYIYYIYIYIIYNIYIYNIYNIYIIYIYIISYADVYLPVYLPVYTYVLKLNTGCTSSVTIASL